MKQKFQVGDVVTLKSSEIAMTIREFLGREGNKYLCNWIDKDRKPQEAVYSEAMLELEDDSDE